MWKQNGSRMLLLVPEQCKACAGLPSNECYCAMHSKLRASQRNNYLYHVKRKGSEQIIKYHRIYMVRLYVIIWMWSKIIWMCSSMVRASSSYRKGSQWYILIHFDIMRNKNKFDIGGPGKSENAEHQRLSHPLWPVEYQHSGCLSGHDVDCPLEKNTVLRLRSPRSSTNPSQQFPTASFHVWCLQPYMMSSYVIWYYTIRCWKGH